MIKRLPKFLRLAKRSLAIISASLGILSGNRAHALPPPDFTDSLGQKNDYESVQKRILKSKLVLKLNSRNGKVLLASHSSHRSHSSHSSHASHYSSSPGGSSRGNGSGKVLLTAAGAVLLYGAYRAIKDKGKK